MQREGERQDKTHQRVQDQALKNPGKLYTSQGWEGVGYVREVAALNTQASSILIQELWLFLVLIAPAQICTFAVCLGLPSYFQMQMCSAEMPPVCVTQQKFSAALAGRRA